MSVAGTNAAVQLPNLTFQTTVEDTPSAHVLASQSEPTATEAFIAKNPDIPLPPDLAADGSYLTNTVTATLHGTVAGVRAHFEENPVTNFTVPTESIPAIEDITYLAGAWPEPGALRRVDLANGYSVHEQVVVNTESRFVYQIWNITAPAGRAINHIKGEFNFDQQGDDVKITWDYNIKPRAFFVRPAINTFLKEDFAPFMQAGMTGTVNAYAPR
ncbi:SRPBCC family protein [uncultured Tateyamaria sp.]|uniref:SRPBCC family protein n=1 Tax=uncultured Tateyamaria sp. TaxID=455651 RepID=UPI0026123FD3|nr:SRPBCC family protein [uncultured Tateyamaria sp.]